MATTVRVVVWMGGWVEYLKGERGIDFPAMVGMDGMDGGDEFRNE